jgi:CSLREA domain-containing protein
MRRGLITVVVAAAVSIAAAGTPSALAVSAVTVDTFVDAFDGSCTDGDCSLRDAIAAVDDGGTVHVPPGFYPLSLSGTGPDAGDLDLVRPVTIVGDGETGSFLDASTLGDRVFDVAADVTLRRLTLFGGSFVEAGGNARVTAGSLRLSRATLVDGRARDGGSLSVDPGAELTIDRSWISGGRALGRGGALFVAGTTVVRRSTLSGNRAVGGGGAYVATSASLTIEDSTLSGNAAVRGGGIRAAGDVDLSSSTIARNRADEGGAALLSAASESTSASSVFHANRSERGPGCPRGLSSLGHNVSDRRGCRFTAPTDLTGVDPDLTSLGPHGGPTPTHALRMGSPAIGHGAGCGPVDQRGAPRHDCDSGAYELVLCLGRPVTIVGTPGPDEFSGGLGRDVFLGLGGADEFQGSLNADHACGGAGADRLIGGPGNDRLQGGSGNDVLLGEAGDDLLLGGRGDDVCRGGAGSDRSRGCETVPS